MTNKATYDPEADALWVGFKPEGSTYDSSEEIAPNVFLEFDREGRVIGLEILGLRHIAAGGALPAPDADAAKPAAE